ncbi:hypothetical protein CUJ84_Chr003549 [Rhizobium leguminosarum]|uniref:Uncharacterized protein n=1 Tax=Rhizobium leguminosarum TaxID=384 RepID=A0A2K9Z6L9_RHILE|nr:hypothetical protein CUJ84_Chr003549 [Rhizobium leguminosarum]
MKAVEMISIGLILTLDIPCSQSFKTLGDFVLVL